MRNDTKTMVRRADYLTYYKIARAECAELMADRKQHTLIPIYEDIWKNNGEEVEYFTPTGSKQPFNTPIQTPSPTTGWIKLDWRQHLISGTSADSKPLYQAFASFFTPNKNELFPFDQATREAYQGKLQQNPNY